MSQTLDQTKSSSPSFRVLYTVPGTGTENSTVFIRRQIGALEQLGVESHLFHIRSRTSPRILFAEYKRLKNELQNLKPDLVHAEYGTMTSFLSALALLGSQIPLVINFQGSDLNPSPGVNRLRDYGQRLLSQLSALRAAHMICVSKQLQQQLLWRRDRVTVLVNPVPLDAFRPQDQQQARAELGWDPDKLIVVLNVRTDPIGKGLALAEAAVERARTILGQEIEFKVLRGDLKPEQMPYVFNAADCLLFTSLWEGAPAVVKEAAGCNLPVVSVDVGDVVETLQGIHPTRIVGRDPDEMAHALCEILKSRQRSNGSELIKNQVSEGPLAQKIIGIYQRITQKQRKHQHT